VDLTSKKSVKEFLKRYQFRPKKGFGQNFLVDRGVLKKTISAANLTPHDTVFEIGPGIGTLTQELAKKVKRVIAVEKDLRMCEVLKETIGNLENVEIINRDILKFRNSDFGLRAFKVVANLPYYIVSPVIRTFLEFKVPKPKLMVLMVQKEVAQRICAKPPKMNLLAASVQFYAKPEVVSFVSKKSFWPQPKVDGAILKIIPQDKSTRVILVDLFFKVVKAGFSQPRKQLINNLSRGLEMDRELVKSWLLENNIQPSQRAETLGIREWIKLVKSYKIR